MIDDAIRSLVISQRLLGTNEIVLIHHTDCGMLTFTDDALRAQIAAETGFKPPYALTHSMISPPMCAPASRVSKLIRTCCIAIACAGSSSTSRPAGSTKSPS